VGNIPPTNSRNRKELTERISWRRKVEVSRRQECPLIHGEMVRAQLHYWVWV
jgi:hypothetical protein